MGQGRPTNAPSVWRRNPPERRLPQATSSKWAITARNGDASDAYAGCREVPPSATDIVTASSKTLAATVSCSRPPATGGSAAIPWGVPRQRKLKE